MFTSTQEWTEARVIDHMQLINQKGYLPVPEQMYRKDDGAIGQILEREFGVEENNLHIADLGTYELKGLRRKKGKPSNLTLFHKSPAFGMTMRQIFERFSYIKPSRRDGAMKRKLFTTIRGDRMNNRGLQIKAESDNEICLYYMNEYLAKWDLSDEKKIERLLLALADTTGGVNPREERFHFVEAYIASGLKSLSQAIQEGAVVMELCMDQPLEGCEVLHDRGPHIRIPVSKLNRLYENVEKIL